MAIDPITQPRPIEGEAPVIENELPAYRAIAPMAIASLILGLAAIFAFVNIYFAAFGALAIAAGVMARRQIRRMPDVWTGSKMADVGTGLGLLFGLSAVTISVVQLAIINHQARKFALDYVATLRSGSLEDAIYFQQHPESRKKAKSRGELVAELKAGMRMPGMFEQESKATIDVIKRLSGPGQSIELGPRLETLVDKMDVYIDFVVTVKGPKTQEFPDETQYGLLRLLGVPDGKTYGWKVFALKFPLPPDQVGM